MTSNRSFRRYGIVFLAPLFAVLAITTLGPIIYVILNSLYYNYLPLGRQFTGLSNYREMLVDPRTYQVVMRTGVYVFSSVFFHIVIALSLAVFLDRKRGLAGRWARTVRSVLIVPWLISWAVAAAVWRLILRPSGVLNAYLMRLGIIDAQIPWLGSLDFAMAWVVAITVWKAFPFFLMMTYAALQTVPNQLYESAQIDGAGVFGQFRHVTLPGIMPTLLTLTVLDIIWSLRQFDVLFLTTGGGPLRSTRTLTLQVYMTAFEGLRFGLASAQGVLIMLLSTIMSVVYLLLYSRAEKNL